ncbi:hypothetical protein TC_0678 [Chlamydia muridarum str. Nigg]|uniref:Uncharacterized protein n=1 Tax=Chlamydia muridarum (strain MoPn / Nigg) TaxID=243161 RepID=Q9PJZ8_CHLMU|nr:hypothetical protein TC_0678 [Chlamydia muridarum str. Nigg]
MKKFMPFIRKDFAETNNFFSCFRWGLQVYQVSLAAPTPKVGFFSLSINDIIYSGMFSVALSVALRPLEFLQHLFLRSPDFPLIRSFSKTGSAVALPFRLIRYTAVRRRRRFVVDPSADVACSSCQ